MATDKDIINTLISDNGNDVIMEHHSGTSPKTFDLDKVKQQKQVF